jgi:hypothetical protein
VQAKGIVIMQIIAIDDNTSYICGGKFDNLRRINSKYDIPFAICITTEMLQDELEHYLDVDYIKFGIIFDELKSTSACYLLESSRDISNLIRNFKLSQQARKKLKLHFQNTIWMTKCWLFVHQHNTKIIQNIVLLEYIKRS